MSASRKGRGQDRKGRSKREGQFVALPYTTLRHPAWRSLSGNAVKVFLELHSRFHGGNNGKLSVSMDEGAKVLHIGKSSVQRAFRELEKAGFIVKMKQGQWYGRQATEWRLTSHSCNGHLATNDWQKRATADPPKNRTRSPGGIYSPSDGPATVPNA